ncbi:5-methylcytosine-specific restriction endonuclease McrA [Terracoccus luteus]|uniref:5-methylcytosine-specific restriction endonuclease McrA n=1 Tax=Terracoccus luteus TaxID=53356 RepID=A0A495Y0J3_9MICO|nr:HNH endonuclease signature motif containing protein [Terracoccus luteus]RKT79712.1 5-methylcytosine-specific restriction endonuclease McrA [Terracoccus luteus]
MFDDDAAVTAGGLEGLLAVLDRVEPARGAEATADGPQAPAATAPSIGSTCLSDVERIDVLSALERVKAAVGAAQVRVTAGFVASQERVSLAWRSEAEAASGAGDFDGWRAAREKADLASWAAALEFGAHPDARWKGTADPSDSGSSNTGSSCGDTDSGGGGGAGGAAPKTRGSGEPERPVSSSRRNTIAKGGVAAQVALARRLSPFKGAEGVRFSLTLTHDMPHTLALLEAGVLSEWRALCITKEAAVLSPEDRRRLDQELHDTYGDRLGRLGDRELNRLVRAVAYRLDPESVVRRARKAESERRVTLCPAPDTMAYLTALLPAAEAVAAYAALTGAAASAKAAGDERGKGQVMADTLVDRILGRASSETSTPDATSKSHATRSDAAACGGEAADEAGSAGSSSPTDGVADQGTGAYAATDPGVEVRDDAAHEPMPQDTQATATSEPCPAASHDGRVDDPAGRAGVDVEVQLVMGLDALFGTGEGADTPAQLLGYGTVPAGWARDFLRPDDDDVADAAAGAGAADGRGGSPPPERGGGLSRAGRVWIRRLFVRPGTGELVAMDSRRRLFSDGLRRFVLTRDAATCRTPWCDAPARHIDHVTPHADGGPTSAANGQGLCVACNLTKEHPDLTSTTLPPNRHGAGGRTGRNTHSGHTVRVTTGTGHTYDSEAPPLLPGAPPPPPKRPRDSGHPFPTLLWPLPVDPTRFTTAPESGLERWLEQLIAAAAHNRG